jgi:threonine aldolase
MIDLRSDTVTKPCPGMLEAMMKAEVGDDVWGDDPTVNLLQAKVANLFGMDEALYCPSGTMTNQIAIKVWTSPGDEVIVSDTAHVKCYEGGGLAFNSGVQCRAVMGDVGGRITCAQIADAINADDPHYPHTAMCCLENTTNKGGGSYYSSQSLAEISALCRSRGLKLHLDGARIFNAIEASQGEYGTQELGHWFDSISICLSKGLGCPVGSLVIGSSAFIKKARRIRKVLGGGMRQAGFLAAAGLYALDHNVSRLADDHAHASMLQEFLRSLPWIVKVRPSPTNIVVFELASEVRASSVKSQLEERGVLISSMGPTLLRLVTHLGITRDDVLAAIEILKCLHIDINGL